MPTQGSPQIHFEALVDSWYNHKPKAMLLFLPRVSTHPATPGTTVPGPTAWKHTLKRGKRESFPKPVSYSWTLGTSKYWKLVIQAASCTVSPAQRHEMQRLQEGCVQEPIPRGLSALSHWASSPTSAGDRAETHHSRARNPHHDAQAERQRWMHLDQKLEMAPSLRKRKKVCDAHFLKCTEKEAFPHFSPVRLISYLEVK